MKKLGRTLSVGLVCLAGLGFEGCGAGAQPEEDGAAELTGYVTSALTTADVAKVTVTISGPGITTPITHDLVKNGAVWRGKIGKVPVGADRTVSGTAYNAAGLVIYSSITNGVTITKNNTVAVALVLQEATPAPPFENAAPVIDAFVAASNAVTPNDTIELMVTAHDPNNDPLVYSWTASSGTFANASSPTPTWRASANEGPATITVRVLDPKNAVAAMTFNVDVAVAHGNGSANVTTGFNNWPEVTSVTATPTLLDVGQTTALALVARDGDGDALTYAWSSSCDGTFDAPTTAAPHFTLASLAASGSCALVVSVGDGRGGTNMGSLSIHTGSLPPANIAPKIDTTFQSVNGAAGGKPVVLRIGAHDPDGTPVTFNWSSGPGTLGTPHHTATTSEVVWTAPDCIGTGSPFAVFATVTDATGVATTQAFQIQRVANDLTSDPLNCGACGNVCAGGEACIASECVITCTPGSQAFDYTGAEQSFVVPSGCSSIAVKAWGAGGAGGGVLADHTSGFGGGGGFTSGALGVSPSETLTIIVGGGGGYLGAATFGGGGSSTANLSGAGGGRSAVRRGGSELLTAGGGGGGTLIQSWTGITPSGGSGGGASGGDAAASDVAAGFGATQLAGGAGAAGGQSGSAFLGGAGGGWHGGGGGGGYFGGGGGGGPTGPAHNGGGGGGSGFAPAGGATVAASGATPPMTSDPAYATGVGAGGGAVTGGGHGRIVLTW